MIRKTLPCPQTFGVRAVVAHRAEDAPALRVWLQLQQWQPPRHTPGQVWQDDRPDAALTSTRCPCTSLQ